MKKSAAPFFFAAAAIAVYFASFRSSFHWDDEFSIYGNPSIRHLGDLGAIWSFWPTRFVPQWTFALNYHWGGNDVFGYHILNFVLHVLTAVFLWRFFLLFPSRGRREGGGAEITAFFAAMLFVCHPVQTEAVTYIVQRATVLSALFSALSLWLYAESASRLERRILYGVSLGAACLAVLCKENAVALPFSILLCDMILLKGGGAERLRRIAPFFLSLLVFAAATLGGRLVDLRTLGLARETSGRLEPLPYLWTQFHVLLSYLGLLILPLRQNLDYDFPAAASFFEPATLAGAAVAVVLLAWAAAHAKKSPARAFCVFWFFVLLAPESSLYPIHDVIAEHRLYLPTAAFAFFAVSAAFDFLERKRAAALLSVWAVLLAGGAFVRNGVWRDELSLWSDGVLKSPRKISVYVARGRAYAAAGMSRQAIADYETALRMKPDPSGVFSSADRRFYANIHLGLGCAYGDLGLRDEAIRAFDDAIRLDAAYDRAYYDRDLQHQLKGDLKKALEDYDQSIAISPGGSEAYVNRGMLYFSAGDYDKAMSDYERAIRIDPRREQAYGNRGSLLARRGRMEEALADFERAVELNPRFWDAAFNRVRALAALGRAGDCLDALGKLRRAGAALPPDLLEIEKSIRVDSR